MSDMQPANIPKISLKAARVNAGLTQKDAAQHLCVSTATLQNYESGATVPGWDLVERIGGLYHYPVDLIIFRRNSLKAN